MVIRCYHPWLERVGDDFFEWFWVGHGLAAGNISVCQHFRHESQTFFWWGLTFFV